ncbi:CENP-B DNA-binding domain protein [Dictyocaulus viviparus]|uniref:CENP-B DNA-binding domain protein n=1 Tax=Dictyocaulus viviparus TaxID=29172 RepID=A0A0D8Y305_DICVI|nr:CENP-B DNA-binding domain protein [Dictyocaulus viviparus]
MEESANATDVIQMVNTNSIDHERRKKKPYKELTLHEKVQLIRLAEENSGMSQAAIAERYTIAKSNVCRILQRKKEYLMAYESAGYAGSRKRKLKGPQSELDECSRTGLLMAATAQCGKRQQL